MTADPGLSDRKRDVCAVIVTFHPVIEKIGSLLDRLSAQVGHVVIVDNTPGDGGAAVPAAKYRNVTILHNNENTGVAAAHNAGINWCRGKPYTHVLILDEDSSPETGMVDELLSALEALGSQGARIAAVGPSVHDSRTAGQLPFYSTGASAAGEARPEHENPGWRKVDYLISSGSLIPLAVLDQTGVMDEKLFIDFVDIEWGYRAASKDFHCYAVSPAKMQHALGDHFLRFRIFGERIMRYRTPQRHYYLFRNFIHMLKQRYVPLRWKVREGGRMVVRFFGYVLCTPDRAANLRLILLGLWHGCRGRLGRL